MILIDALCVYIYLSVITNQLELSRAKVPLSDHCLINMAMLKPVYLRDNDIQIDKKNYVRDFEISIAVSKSISDLKCVQRDRDLWRLYVGSRDSRDKLLSEGFELRNISVKAFDINPYSAGIHNPNEQVLRITVKGVPLSVDDGEITKMLEKFNVTFTSGIKYEKIRDPETRKMTGILNGNRFIYVKQFEEGKFLPRTSHCAGLRCFIYHFGQPKVNRTTLCTNCWETTHYKSNCENESRCKVCKQTGHEPGDAECEAFLEHSSHINVLVGKDNVLSNFYASPINIFGVTHKSAEHAVQYVKAMRSGDVPRATAVQEASTALDARKIGNQVVPSPSFTEQRETLMREIIEAKVAQVPAFKDALQKSHRKSTFVETTFDDFWGSGLSKKGTLHTNASKWPGANKLGSIIADVANIHRRTGRSWSVPRNTVKLSQMDIPNMLNDLKSPRKRSRSGKRRPSPNSERMRNSEPTDADTEDSGGE